MPQSPSVKPELSRERSGETQELEPAAGCGGEGAPMGTRREETGDTGRRACSSSSFCLFPANERLKLIMAVEAAACVVVLAVLEVARPVAVSDRTQETVIKD